MNVQARLVFCWLYLQVSFVSMLTDTWEAEVVPKIEALVKSCVVVPCTYNYPGTSLPTSRIRAIWHKKDKNENIYHEDQISVADNFKGRTKLLGNLGQKNCTLEIDEVRDHDNGPFCFRIEIPRRDNFSFREQCVTISMISSPKKPALLHQEYFVEEELAVFKCSVKHTCPSRPPSLTWSRSSDVVVLQHHKLLYEGTWEVETVLSFTTKEQDHNTNITCKADFHANVVSENTFRMFVKGKQKLHHIIIPVVTVLAIIILLGVVGFFVIKKYKKQIQELQSRNENGLWNRISRVSRRSDNCAKIGSEMAGFSKARFPSPKSGQKTYNRPETTCSVDYDDDYTNLADVNIYGNV